jgi:hypothetical protein
VANVDFLDSIGRDKGTYSKGQKFGTVISEVLYIFGESVVEDLQTNLTKNKSIASGALSESINFTITDEPNGDFKFQLKLLDYYLWVDKGRKAGKQPPPGVILKWLGYKRINLSKIYAKPVLKGGHKPKALSEISKMKTLAYLIGRKIGREGTKATNFYSTVVNENSLEKLRRALAKALRRDILIELSK